MRWRRLEGSNRKLITKRMLRINRCHCEEQLCWLSQTDRFVSEREKKEEKEEEEQGGGIGNNNGKGKFSCGTS